MSAELEGAKTAIVAWATGHPEILKISLFGSRIRGTDKHGCPVRRNSDLDIAIAFDGSLLSQFGWKERMELELQPLIVFRPSVWR
ncbi:MAG TPA: nucleotidyltransferase domain-containing protein, partial [Candidatus Cybelea sp.]|nr:nucleotidyltransferase domain-containing protein [Candidatus Cybelea sp.]